MTRKSIVTSTIVILGLLVGFISYFYLNFSQPQLVFMYLDNGDLRQFSISTKEDILLFSDEEMYVVDMEATRDGEVIVNLNYRNRNGDVVCDIRLLKNGTLSLITDSQHLDQCDTGMEVSPDGNQIAFVRNSWKAEEFTEIHTVNRVTGEQSFLGIASNETVQESSLKWDWTGKVELKARDNWYERKVLTTLQGTARISVNEGTYALTVVSQNYNWSVQRAGELTIFSWRDGYILFIEQEQEPEGTRVRYYINVYTDEGKPVARLRGLYPIWSNN